MNSIDITSILDTFNIERQKCKCCGGDIIYSNTNIYARNGRLIYRGKNFNTVKVIDGTSYKLMVCENCLKKLFPNITNIGRIFNVMAEPTRFAFDIPEDVYLEKRKNYAMTESKMISKYGNEEGQKRWNKYCERQSETNTFEYKHKTYGWSKEEFDAYNKSRSVTLKNLIKRHGKEKGRKMWDDYCKKQSLTKSWDYMVEKYGIDKAREINKSKALCLETFVRKYGPQKGYNKFLDYIQSNQRGYSKISQVLFQNLDVYLKDKYSTYYFSKNGEYTVENPTGAYRLDFFIKELNICIEFNGSCYHGDERLYKDNDRPNPFKQHLTAKEIREKDKERYLFLFKENNIKTFVIWELDFNPEEFDYKKYITDTLKINI